MERVKICDKAFVLYHKMQVCLQAIITGFYPTIEKPPGSLVDFLQKKELTTFFATLIIENMERIIRKGLIIIIMLISIVGLTACDSKESPQKRIEWLTGIKLPKEMDVEYHYLWQAFQGDFFQYTIFNLKEEPTEFLSKFSLSGKLQDSKEREILNQLASFNSHSKSIPKEYFPNWDNEYFEINGINIVVVQSGEIYVLFFPDALKLVFYISTN